MKHSFQNEYWDGYVINLCENWFQYKQIVVTYYDDSCDYQKQIKNTSMDMMKLSLDSPGGW